MKLKLNNENNDHILTPFYISIRLDYGKVLDMKNRNIADFSYPVYDLYIYCS
jgi:hypothetical protein